MITKFVFVRHGNAMTIPEDESETVFRQWKKSSLTSFGKLQAEAVSKAPALYNAEVLFCSLYERALKTAETIIEYHPHLYINTDALLNELTRIVDGEDIYGNLNEAYRKWRGKMIQSANIYDKFDINDQSLYEKLVEILQFMSMVTKSCRGQNIVVVGHSQVFALFLAYVDMINNKNESCEALVYYFNKRFMDNGALTTIEYDDQKEKWTITRFNDTRHLP